jgi:cytochrome c-type biogenesis protein CcmE
MKKTNLIALVLLAVSMGIIIVALGDSSKYVTFNKAAEYPNEQYHVVGKLVEEKPMIYEPRENPNKFTFHLKDEKGNVRKVIYNDAKPRDITQTDRIVLVGEMKNQETFHAERILMKCPSKYKQERIKGKKKEMAKAD